MTTGRPAAAILAHEPAIVGSAVRVPRPSGTEQLVAAVEFPADRREAVALGRIEAVTVAGTLPQLVLLECELGEMVGEGPVARRIRPRRAVGR